MLSCTLVGALPCTAAPPPLKMEINSMSEALQLHAQTLKSGNNQRNHQHDLTKIFTFSALSSNGDLTYARLILDSVPSPNSFHYNTMIRAYSRSPDPIKALHFFLSVIRNSPTIPDKFTYPFLLKSCARLGLTHQGKQLHGLIVKSGFGSDRYVQHSLIHMYCACQKLGHAFKVFDKMRERDVVSWTAMIDGLVDNDRPLEAMKLFEKMIEDKVEVNEVTVVSVLRACAEAGALSVGRRVHEVVKEQRIELKAHVSTALIDMYAKCGCIESAMRVFDEINVDKDVYSWTAMIAGLASHGNCQEALDLFNQMQELNINPDERTMTAVLSAYRNAGWVREGYTCLKTMHKKYGVWPTIQHYGCVVDLLARVGHLSDAEELIKNMPIKPDGVLWRTLIWACKVHKDMNRAERLIEHLESLKMDSNDDCGNLVLIGNVYASAGKWLDKARTRELMNKRGLVKPPGASKIEIDEAIHEFIVGDSDHPEAEKIYAKLDEIEEKLREEEYQPKLHEVLLEVDDEEKAFQLSHHSEKLALAFGLIKTSPGTEIRIVKNLRSCEDCHAFMKVISKKYQRDIIMRDRIRFHHFSNGICSCKDYW
ncbi:pentatricopeptide repeat-containing protein At4g21065-like [Humulus lupulus]|uniref:pentatricopeptide repeat-containing protein At4g21065-like n=1 Tax=Humulus lupulus TaxID=3486 RepID=UPI002B40B1F3|nr:pentatricopeptide repeat-containing protein At4g21065-like [Humulus lupulus]